MKKSFKANIRELKHVTSFLHDEISRYVDKKNLMLISVSVEEIFVNILKYAYKNKGACVDITIAVNETERRIAITFEDSGIPFNPLNKKDPDTTAPASQRKIGGLGIFITKKVMDQIEYAHQDGKNILTLYKNY